jgi:hypothetical protein
MILGCAFFAQKKRSTLMRCVVDRLIFLWGVLRKSGALRSPSLTPFVATRAEARRPIDSQPSIALWANLRRRRRLDHFSQDDEAQTATILTTIQRTMMMLTMMLTMMLMMMLMTTSLFSRLTGRTTR